VYSVRKLILAVALFFIPLHFEMDITADAIALLFLLIGLELVLGVDNILVIAIIVARLPEKQQNSARMIGLMLALGVRVIMVSLAVFLIKLQSPIWPYLDDGEHAGRLLHLLAKISPKDLILMAGGLFLLWKAVKEIHETVEKKDGQHGYKGRNVYSSAIVQIVLIDIIFSVDSVITAVGLTDQMWIIVTAVLVSFAGILAFAKPIGDFILENPALKILALSFLVTIGVTIFLEGMHQHVAKAYIYLPMGFALVIELLQMRYQHNREKKT
jgi:predicted tellurium resistance membrane protein TerC